MEKQQRNTSQHPAPPQSERPQGQDANRQDQDLSQGSETLDDALQEDQRDHSDNGKGKRGVLNR